MKKILSFVMLVLSLVIMISCEKNEAFVVEFDTVGGSSISNVEVLDGVFVLPGEPVKEGYLFDGWFLDKDYKNAVVVENVKEDCKLYAKWKSQKFTVTFVYGENNELNDVVEVEYGKGAVAPSVDDVKGMVFVGWDKDFTQVTENMTVNAKYSSVAYTYVFKNGEEVFAEMKVGKDESLVSIPDVPAIEGKIGYWDTLDFFEATGDKEINTMYIDSKDVETIEDYGNSVVERYDLENGIRSWVFFEGETYPFDGFNIKLIASPSVAVQENNSIKMVGTGLFYVELSNNAQKVSYIGKVVSNAYDYSLGESLNEYLQIINNIKDETYLNKETVNYQVGVANDFIFDLLVVDKNNERINTDFDFSVSENGEKITEGYSVSGNRFSFNKEMSGKNILISAKPKYFFHNKDEKVRSIDMYIELNDGYNVFTHDELKRLYADIDVTMLNIHSSIEAVLSAEQLNPNGTPKNYFTFVGMEDVGNCYTRVATNVKDNNLVINGNYFTINAQNIPVCKPALDLPEYANQGGRVTADGIFSEDFLICSVQVGIFGIQVVDSDSINENGTSGNSVTFNNLTLLGNSKTVDPIGTEFASDDEKQEAIKEYNIKVSENSGGLDGIVSRSTDVITNNVNIGYTTIGVFQIRFSADLYANYTSIYSSWGNAIYGWGSHLTQLRNCYIKNSGGAAIQLDDVEKLDHSTKEYYDPYISIDETSVFDNYVSGEEPWFMAYGLTASASQIKSTLEGGINQLSQGKLTIIKNFTHDNVNAEKFNLVFLSRPNLEDVPSEQSHLYHGRVSLNVCGVDIKREHDFTKNDLRAVALQGTYLGLAGYDVNGEIFNYTLGMLTSQGKPVQEAIPMAIASQFATQGIGNGYLEIVTELPGNGNITILTTINPKI